MKISKYSFWLFFTLLVFQIYSLYATPKEKQLFYASDSLFTMEFPSDWVSGVMLNQLATLQAKTENNQAYIIVIPEAKSNFSADFTLAEYAKIISSKIFEKLQNGKISKPSKSLIDKQQVIQCEISGSLQNFELNYFQTALESKHHYFQILTWSLKPYFKKYQKSVKKIINSFRVLPFKGYKTSPFLLSKTFLASDSLCQINIPSHWIPYKDLNETANIQVGSKKNDMILITISEAKTDFKDINTDMNLEAYLKLTVNDLKDATGDSSDILPSPKTFNGYNALQVEFHQQNKLGNLTYCYTVLESDLYYHQVLIWGYRSLMESHKVSINKILQSFTSQEKLSGKLKNCAWEIQSPNKTQKLYLVGSIHLLSKLDYPLSPVIEDIYNRSNSIFFETSIDSMDLPSIQKLFLKKAMLTNQTLKSILSDQTYQLLSTEAQKSNIPLEKLEKFKPWFTSTLLAIMKLKTLGVDQNYGFDKYFFSKAQKDKKTIFALETVDYQSNLLNGLDQENQELMLIKTLKSLKDIERDFSQILNGWRYGNIEYMDEKLNDRMREHPALYEKLLIQRNKNWLKKIDDLVNRKVANHTMIIVGTAHLIGEDSLIDLLSNKGYHIKQF